MVTNCKACGQERESLLLDTVDTPRGAYTVCKHADADGTCIESELWRVVYRVANGNTEGGYDGVLVASDLPEASVKAVFSLGQSVRALHESPSQIVWTQIQGYSIDHWYEYTAYSLAVTE